MDLKAKLEEQMKTKGEVNINSDTLAREFTANDTVATPKDNMDTATSVKLSDKVKNDGMLKASEGSLSTSIAAEMEKIKSAALAQQAVISDLDSPDFTLDITPEEKHIFLDALVSNSRFVLPFSLFNGRYTGEFRTRTQAESYAIFQLVNKELRVGGIENQMGYSMRLRNMLFAAQIKQLNGVDYAEIMEPLLPIVAGDTITAPGWIAQTKIWDAMNDGLLKVLHEELRKFEYKYRTMLENANDQNFWKAELPI